MEKADRPEQTRKKELTKIKNKVLSRLDENWESALDELDSEEYSLKVFFEGEGLIVSGDSEFKNVSIKNIFKLRNFGVFY